MRGHHIYKEIWTPVIGEDLMFEREPSNSMDPYAVAVIKQLEFSGSRPPSSSRSSAGSSGTVVGHVPRKILAACNIFLRKNGDTGITYMITGNRHHSTNLPQGGLDVPCELHFFGKKEYIAKIKKLLVPQPDGKPQSAAVEKLTFQPTEPSCKKFKVDSNIEIESAINRTLTDSPVKINDHNLEESSNATIIIGDEAADTSDCTPDQAPWLSLQRITLVKADKIALTTGSELTDMHINFAQAILKAQFSRIRGLYSTLLLVRFKAPFSCTGDAIQIMHTRGSHCWIVVSTVGCGGKDVNVFDSLYSSVDKETVKIINLLFGNLRINMAGCPQQSGTKRLRPFFDSNSYCIGL